MDSARCAIDHPAQALALDLNLDPSAVASAEDLCANSDPPGACKPPPESSDVSPNAQCTIAVGQSSSEIRTKVFRIGAPLLRSTIPVSLGARGGYGGGRVPAAPAPEVKTRREGEEEKEGSDIETILSLSDGEAEPEELLSVTLDFPC
ncbi:unnamed protein product [Durusdinium trenchii]|uniref:Uncharacterized protein n=2 Tax=Durusdinium trenchii TaxID=1381693 RepID=A0ABP0R8V1_9DINO|eukprot:g8666.t1